MSKEWDDRDIRGMVRKGDPFTCVMAAKSVQKKISGLHVKVMAEFRGRGAMNDKTLERLPVFSMYEYSTVRKRRTELTQGGLLVCVGTGLSIAGTMMQLWDIPPPQDMDEQQELF